MDDLQLGEAVRRIREDPAAEDSRVLLGGLLAELTEDLPEMTSVDVPRLRALAAMISDTAPHNPGAERAAAKMAAATIDKVADFLAGLGEIASREFGLR
jgi:hypothetical protein